MNLLELFLLSSLLLFIRLSLTQLKALATHLGHSEVPNEESSVADVKIAGLVQTYLQDWKEKRVNIWNRLRLKVYA